ncbi:FimV/HubP family polar landmark protein [Porticoccus sp.]
MKLRHLTLAAGLFGVVVSNQTFAVGLGELKLNSALNEPLDAEIQLLNVGELSELEMLVGLGSQKDFDNAGVERPFSLTDLRFEVDLSKLGNPVILVTSRKPLREPFVDFLVEVDWPTGRLLREYTVLLDLPVYATEKPSAKKIEAASSGSQPASQPRRQSPAPAATAAVSAPSLAVGDDEYRVSGGDTVWAIAEKIRPQGASMAQTMAAIKQANPHAFINDNINLLKKGAVLRLPEGSDIAALSDVSVDLTPSAVASNEAQAPMLDATPMTSVTGSSDVAGEGRLKLAALGADEALTSAAAGVDGGDAAGVDAAGSASDVLTVAQEELDKTVRENTELKDRIAKLEEQLSTMNRLVEIQDDSLRGAQVATQVDQEAEPITGGVSEQALNDDAETAVAVAEEAMPELESEVESGKDKTFDLASLMDYLLYPAIGLLALLLAVLMFFRNRKPEEEEVDELSLQSLVDRQEPEAPQEERDQLLTADDKEYIAALAEELDDEEQQDFDALQELEELQLGDGEGVDPKGEADIYLSLGNYRQAENILKGAIETDPEDSSLRMKLLEVYVNANNLEAFDEQQAQLAALNNPEADARAMKLRAELSPETMDDSSAEPEVDIIEEVEEAAPTIGEQQSGEGFDAPSLDYDLGDVSPELVASLTEGAAQEKPGGDELDVPESDDELVASATSPSTEPVAEDFDLDLDLGDIDLDSLSSEIDQGMFDIDLDEPSVSEPSAVEEPPAAAEVDDSFGAPESLKEQTFEELEDSILSAADTESDDAYDVEAELKDFGDEDVCDTKLVLAETYLDLGDPDNARDLLNEVVDEGTEEQKEKARNMLDMVT